MPELIAHAIETPMLLVFAGKAFDLANPGEIIVQQRVHRGGGAALQSIAAMRRERVSERATHEERQRHEGQQRKPRIHKKHHA